MPGRRMLAAVLFLPLLFGANAGSGARPGASDPISTIAAIDAATAAPALPGNSLSSLFSALELPVIRPAAGPRTDDASADAGLLIGASRAARLDLEFLRYAPTLSRARLNIPTTSGNPPPVSAT